MNDIFLRKAKCWNHRLRALMDAKGYKQERFAEALNKRYETRYEQKTISRWLHIGEKTSVGVNGFPKYDTMLNIADFFGVDVGYLTGETDYVTFQLSDACAYLGLNAEAVNSIRALTRPEIDLPYLETTRKSVSILISANGFSDVVDSICNAYSASKSFKEKFEDIIGSDDGPGHEASQRLSEKYSSMGYYVRIEPQYGKDFNEDLVNTIRNALPENKRYIFTRNEQR